MRQKPLRDHFFEAFYEKYFDKVFNFISRRVKSREDAMDLTHDVFLKAYKNREKIQAIYPPDKYLFTIVRNLLIDYYRRSINNAEFLSLTESELPQPTPSGDEYFSTDQMQSIHQAIEALPGQRKEVFKLKKLEGLSTEEISSQLSISKRTVENQVYRATLTLRRQLAGLFTSLF